jgi:alanine dehydrogenase
MEGALKTLLLTQRDVARLLDVRAAIRVVRESFKALARGEALMPPKIYLRLPGGDDFRAMPAFLRRPAAAGVKWVNVHARNPARGLPTVMAVIVINDPATGVPLAIMDGLLITKLRTAASAAVAAQALARRGSRVVGLVGCGAQGDTLLLALAELFPLARIKVWGYFPQEAPRFCRRMQPLLPRAILEPCATIERTVRDAEILMTVTPSRRPLVKRGWLAPGVHVNAIGADAAGKQELDPRILRAAAVVVDDREQAVHAGELNVPIRRGQFRARDIRATLGDILIGRQVGRRAPREITVFDSTGLAIHDVALGWAAMRQARRRGIGRRLALFTS